MRKQAQYEEDVIIKMGFPGYFLTVADYINWAKSQASAWDRAVARARARWWPTP